MKYTIESDFQKLFPPLSEDELRLLKEANEDDPEHERIPAVVLWKADEKTRIVVEGHHTLAIRENLRRPDGKPVRIIFDVLEFPDRQHAIDYARRAQLSRRNLHPSLIAIHLAQLLPKAPRGGDRKSHQTSEKQGQNQSANLHFDRDAVAEERGISTRTLKSADKVVEHGAKAIIDAVQQGEVAVSDAAAIVDLPKSEQTAALAKVKAGKARTLRAAAPKAKPKPKAGKVKFDYKNFESVFGKLVRLIDDHHRVHPDPTMRDACHESLNTMLADFKAWRRKVKA